jgi:nitrogen fixation/metabolism regulation signal transduction histidine kinase
MMSIRSRLVIMCLVVALLPAVPLTFLVRSLLERSFDLGLNPTVENALQSGLAVSRAHLEEARGTFRLHVQRVVSTIGESRPDSADAAAVLTRAVGASHAIDGLVVSRRGDGETGSTLELSAELRPFQGQSHVLDRLLAGAPVESRDEHSRMGYAFYETIDHSKLLAVWNPAVAHIPPQNAQGYSYRILFYRLIDPRFLADADALLEGRQIFAELRLTQRSLARSFFYPFLIIYGVCLVLALGLALFMAERLAEPIRKLARGANAVASGDWRYRLDLKAGGETGCLVSAFNEMVSRLESQRRRLTDAEKMASWREMARRLAHEIKNPLLPIRLTMEELRARYHGEDPRYRSMLEESTRVVGDELDTLQALVKEFSAFARLPEMKPRSESLENLVRDVAQMYPRAGTSIVAKGQVRDFRFDPDQLRRVLVNLFDNAVSVVGDDHRCAIDITLEEAGDEAVLTFGDNGPGLPPGKNEEIFEPYFTTRPGGTGLGLAVVKNIVLLHGGAIRAWNREGGGAVFEIRLPLAGPAAVSVPENENQERKDSFNP